jgi:hypothetical protein
VLPLCLPCLHLGSVSREEERPVPGDLFNLLPVLSCNSLSNMFPQSRSLTLKSLLPHRERSFPRWWQILTQSRAHKSCSSSYFIVCRRWQLGCKNICQRSAVSGHLRRSKQVERRQGTVFAKMLNSCRVPLSHCRQERMIRGQQV